MARISEILEIEKQRTDKEQWNVINLFKEGGFYRAYEWSAWLIVTMAYNDEARQQTGDRKPLNVTHKRSRNRSSPISSKFIKSYNRKESWLLPINVLNACIKLFK